MKDRIYLFITALIQVLLVVLSSVSIFNKNLLLIGLTGFLISYVWTLNVKRAAFGDQRDRIIYASGALCGTYIGYFLGHYLNNIL